MSKLAGSELSLESCILETIHTALCFSIYVFTTVYILSKSSYMTKTNSLYVFESWTKILIHILSSEPACRHEAQFTSSEPRFETNLFILHFNLKSCLVIAYCVHKIPVQTFEAQTDGISNDFPSLFCNRPWPVVNILSSELADLLIISERKVTDEFTRGETGMEGVEQVI